MENFTFVLMTVLEKVLEAIYFSVFLIYGKNLTRKRLLFIVLMTVEYLLLKTLYVYNTTFQILYIFLSFGILKILYGNKAQITDIFLMGAASIILIVISLFSYMIIYHTISIYFVALILNRFLLFSFLFLFRNKIYEVYKKVIKLWNRHNDPNKMKSLTLRNVCVLIFNLMFAFINFGMVYSAFLN